MYSVSKRLRLVSMAWRERPPWLTWSFALAIWSDGQLAKDLCMFSSEEKLYLWWIFHPWLVSDVGEAFGKYNHFVTGDVILFQGFVDDLFANSVRVNVCSAELSYAEVDRILGRRSKSD